jgi:hypothetical protein
VSDSSQKPVRGLLHLIAVLAEICKRALMAALTHTYQIYDDIIVIIVGFVAIGAVLPLKSQQYCAGHYSSFSVANSDPSRDFCDISAETAPIAAKPTIIAFIS